MENSRGLTLIEVVIAMAAFSIISLSSITFFEGGRNQRLNTQRMDYALGLAEDLAEKLRSQSYYAVVPTVPMEIFNRYGTDFMRNFAASEVTTFDEVYKIIAISVTWNWNNVDRDVELMTIISKEQHYTGTAP